MAENSDPDKKAASPGVLWPGVFAGVAVVCAYLVYKAPLETARPEAPVRLHSPSPRTVKDIGAVYARLWEDPLEAAYRDPDSEDVDILPRDRFRKIVDDSKEAGNHKLLFMPVLVPGGPYAEDKETRIRTRYALLAALGTCGYKLALPNRMSYMKVPVVTYFDVLDDSIGETGPASLMTPLRLVGKDPVKPLIIPVKLYRKNPIILYHHDAEKPTREDAVQSQPGDDHKLFGGVLVCWLNADQLGDRPLGVILQIFNFLFPEEDGKDRKKDTIQVRILGPTGSDGLRSICKEDQEWSDQWYHRRSDFTEFPCGTELVSPRATVWPKLLDSASGNGEQESTFELSASRVKLVRTIGTDKVLVEALQKELKDRDAWPENKEPKDHVVLITERDTLYGRALPATFRKEMDDSISKDNLHVVTYLRGIDGAIPAKEQDEAEAPQQEAGAAADEPPEGRAQLDYLRRLDAQLARLDESLRRERKGRISAIGVVGTDVYDKLLVLRALRKRFSRVWFFTTDLDARFNHADELAHTRNLLVASHFDLELRRDLQRDVPPFRDSYQTSTFFAALLALRDPEAEKALEDARVKRAAENPNVREVLRHPDAEKALADPEVTKDLDPEVRKALQDPAVKKAVLNPEAREKLRRASVNDPWGMAPDCTHQRLQPLVFEIGRHGPYQLTKTRAHRENPPSVSGWVHPPSPREQPWLYHSHRCAWLVVGAIALFSCIVFIHSTTRRTLLGVWHAFCDAMLRLLWRFLRGSAWLMKAVQSRLSNTSSPRLWKALHVIGAYCDRLAGRMRRRFTPQDRFVLLISVLIILGTFWLISKIVSDHDGPGGEPFSLLEGISVWPSTLIRFVAVVLGLVFLHMGTRNLDDNQDEIGKKYFGLSREQSQRVRKSSPLSWLRWLRNGPPLPDSQRGMRVSSRTGKKKTVSAGSVYARYCREGRQSCRLLVTFVFSLLYSLFGLSLFRMTDFPNCPARGEDSRLIASWVLLPAIFFMIVLLFFVLDAARLCRHFVRSLADDKTKGWRRRGIEAICEQRSNRAEDLREVLIVQVIAQRTRVVGKLMFYPCFVIFLLILSRLPLLDNWDWPWPLVLLIALNLGAVVLGAVALKNDARKARARVLGRLQDGLSAAVGNRATERAVQQRLMIKEIEAERRGAFSPLASDPFFLQLLWPAGGAGGLLLLDRVLPLF